jgi:hypothetical protein
MTTGWRIPSWSRYIPGILNATSGAAKAAPDFYVIFQFIEPSPKFVILSERKRVEGSSHRFNCKYYPSAKILRLRAAHSAQNDMVDSASQQPDKLQFYEKTTEKLHYPFRYGSMLLFYAFHLLTIQI